ncbi:hypothetical protein KAT24_00580 [Candidatus Pacearchaeota archaeon]|nr:hypothetical protein [Candidatus Pacearchaeota archaeon]
MKLYKMLGPLMITIFSLMIGCKMEEKDMYGFTVQNWKAVMAGFPREDAFDYDEEKEIACVVDGVTRDFIDGSVVGKNIESLIKVKKGLYPNYAKDASRIVVEGFMGYKSFELANERVWDYNLRAGLVPPDYLAKDLAGCTAAGVFEEGGEIHWSFIADSGVAIVDRQGNLKFKTSDEGPHSHEKNPYLEAILKANGGFVSAKGRKIIRSQYRNNPDEPFAYGVLTGEPEAGYYIRKGTIKPNSGDYVLLFSDGVGEIIFLKNEEGKERLNEEFVEKLMRSDARKLERYCKKRIGTEGTLVVWNIE